MLNGNDNPYIVDAAMLSQLSFPADDHNPFEFIHDQDFIQGQDTLQKSEHQGALIATAGSPTGSYQDSYSDDSSSPRRADSSSSSNAAMKSGDVTMTDDSFKPEDFIWEEQEDYQNPNDGGFSFGGDGTINPATLDPGSSYDAHDQGGFNFGNGISGMQFDLGSDYNSPSPFNANAVDGTSPQTNISHNDYSVKASPSVAPSPLPAHTHKKRHSQYSLSKSMNGLHTNGSREVSPASHMVFSQGSSPSAFLRHSPSPRNDVDYSTHLAMGKPNGNALWAPGPDVPGPSLGQGGPVPGLLNRTATIGSIPFPMMQQPPYPVQRPQLLVNSIPPKSRVETQIPIKLTLAPMPPGIKRLHLPPHTISKPKLMAKPRPNSSPDMLELYTMLVCSSAMESSERKDKALARAATCGHPSGYSPDEANQTEDDNPKNGGEVRICGGCILREQKRAARKKSKKPDEEEIWQRDEHKRVVVFNTSEVKDWAPPPEDLRAGQGAMQIEAPMRIACYCRHHHEKTGFQVIFTLRNHLGEVVAQAMSPSIMITDDHKTQAVPAPLNPANNHSEASVMPKSSNTAETLNSLQPGHPFRQSHSVSDIQALKRNVSVPFAASASSAALSQPTTVNSYRNLSRPASPTALCGPSKKRKASGSKVPSNLHMTRLETHGLPVSQPINPQSISSTATSPYTTHTTPPFTVPSPNLTTPFAPSGHGDTMYGQMPTVVPTPNPLFPTGPPTPNNNDQVLFPRSNRTASVDNLNMTPMYSAPVSAHASRAPSPNGLRNGVLQPQQQAQFNQALISHLSASVAPVAPTQPRQSISVIHKVIPNEGPSSGGIEVTILGSGFYQGLEVMFGESKATTTTFWGESSLVCLLPPSSIPGPVQVTLKQRNGQAFPNMSARQPAMFTYLDDNENAVIRMALSVLHQKMTGNMKDVSDFARHILNGAGVDNNSGNHGASGDGYGNGGRGYNVNLETELMDILALLDLDDSPNRARFNFRRKTGHTMLHYSCALGLHRFTAGLLVRGAKPNIADKGGYTPLHFAAMYDHPEIVRRLIQHCADPTLRTTHGLTAADVARTRSVVRAIRSASRRGSTLHSRANSATSLRSLWEPLSGPAESAESPSGDDDFESDSESLEYTSGDLSSAEDLEADDGSWLSMRRGSTQRSFAPLDSSPSPVEIPHAEDLGGMASPTVAVAALKEQFAAQLQQFQQTMTAHLQNLSHVSYLPNMPPLPDYQQYLNSAPIMQRMSSLLPNIGGSRPGSADDQPPPHAKEMDGRWWNRSSLMAATSAPPPAYEDIFPQGDLDRKQSSAALAAVDAEADSKCAALFDQQVQATTAPPRQLPKLLQIGRKNNITKEQQDNLRRAHAENLKKLSRDRNLFFIWIPLLVVMLCAMLYGRFPGVFTAVFGFLSRAVKTATNQVAPGQIVV